MTSATFGIRAARRDDVGQLLELWALVYDQASDEPAWRHNAKAWFARAVEDPGTARIPVIEVGGAVVCTAIGTLELGVPNPHSTRGRAVRLANVITLPAHRGKGLGTAVVRDVIDWARSVDADRVDLSATPDGQRIYEKAGFVLTTAPRMKLEL